MKRFPLRIAIPALLILYAVITGAYSLWYNGRNAAARIEEESLFQLTHHMTRMQGTLDYLLREGNVERIQAEIAVYGADPTVTSALVIDDQNQVLAAMQNALLNQPVANALTSLSHEDAHAVEDELAKVRTVLKGTARLLKGGRIIMGIYPLSLAATAGEVRPTRVGALFMLQDIGPFKAQAQRAVERQALQSALFLITLALVLWGVSYVAVTRRVNRLVTTAGRFAAGKLEARAQLRGYDELSVIGEAFDRMAEQVQQDQRELEEREERFRQVVEAAPNAMVMIDAKGIIALINAQMESLFGYKRSELIGRPIEMLVTEHDRDKHQGLREGFFRKPQPRAMGKGRDLFGLRKDGTEVPIEIGLSPLQIAEETFVLAAIVDITRRKLAEERLFVEKERAQVTLHSIGDAVITTDVEGRIDYMNPVAETLTCWRLDEVRGQPLNEVLNVVNEITRRPPQFNIVERCLHEGRSIGLANHTVLINRAGRDVAIEDSAAPIRDRDQNIIGIVIVFHDVSKAREMAKHLSWQASHDALTGLHNRPEFENRLHLALAAARESAKTHCLLYMDLDQFKVVNDTCGHRAGDELLRQLALLFSAKMRDNDTLARLGGDEFGILLEGCPLAQGRRIAENLCSVVRDFRYVWQDKSFELSASIGLVEINDHNFDMTIVLSRADMSCYMAKESGRNRVHAYEEGDQDIAQRHGEMEWVTRLTRALEEDRLVLYAQAIVPLDDRSDSHHREILLRLRDEEGRIVLPGAFIGAAERYNFMPTIDRWVIRTLFRLIAEGALNGAHPQQTADSYTVNLSGASLNDPQFLAYVHEQFDTLRVVPDRICFEITETAAIGNLARAVRLMHDLKARGCRFALDDFGSGVSSFTYLKNLPVDYLKIDGNFVRDIAVDPIDRAMVAAINQIGHVMGIKTIAEFVENAAILAELKSIGVDYGQGYVINIPYPLLPDEAKPAVA